MSGSKHLYMLLFPSNSLVASMLPPDAFARHFQSGSARHYRGKLVFAEIESEFRHEYFQIDAMMDQLVPHKDGRPKATKFVSSYRVLEHMDFDAILQLYLATSEGYTLALERQDDAWAQAKAVALHVYAEICPLGTQALSRLGPDEFGRYICNPDYSNGAPRIFFAEVEHNTLEFMHRFEFNPFVPAPLPGQHPGLLYDAAKTLLATPDQKVKGISLHTSLMDLPWQILGPGFWLCSQKRAIHWPMPDPDTIRESDYRFFKSM